MTARDYAVSLGGIPATLERVRCRAISLPDSGSAGVSVLRLFEARVSGYASGVCFIFLSPQPCGGVLQKLVNLARLVLLKRVSALDKS